MLSLDATAYTRMMWQGKDTRGIVFVDINPYMKPMIVADDKQLPFLDRAFDRIYCDPPMWLESGNECEVPIMKRIQFSMFDSHKQYLNYVKGTNSEFKRVIKDSGELHMFLVLDEPYYHQSIEQEYSNFTKSGDYPQPKQHYTSRTIILKPSNHQQ